MPCIKHGLSPLVSGISVKNVWLNGFGRATIPLGSNLWQFPRSK